MAIQELNRVETIIMNAVFVTRTHQCELWTFIYFEYNINLLLAIIMVIMVYSWIKYLIYLYAYQINSESVVSICNSIAKADIEEKLNIRNYNAIKSHSVPINNKYARWCCCVAVFFFIILHCKFTLFKLSIFLFFYSYFIIAHQMVLVAYWPNRKGHFRLACSLCVCYNQNPKIMVNNWKKIEKILKNMINTK